MLASKIHQEFANKILQFIASNDNFLISSHMNSDGDAIASALAIHMLLTCLNKKSALIFHDQKIDKRFDYLNGFKNIIPYKKELDLSEHLPKGKIENAIILDVPGYGRLGDVAEILPPKDHLIKIDHHPLEDEMGIIDWVDVDASSSTVMVHEIIEAAGITIDLPMAEAIFSGIVYDTGRFSFSNTTARDLYVCSKMVVIGVKPSDITNRIFFENSFSALKIIGKGLCSLENYLDGAVNVVYLAHEDMQKNNQSEIEELANYSVAIRGGMVGLFIREIEKGFHKVSFRSHSNVDVNKVAKAFDGGGHARAAGCRIDGKKEDIISRIIAEIQKQM
ncbi:MAG: bifunctional oligoribonuclease/PAP phosphatase NrnA [Calditrichaceae bacterium]|nr:bifunctional oligoribonuclease/PAP phosphatase NrnA [Calditrichaceae bacterium]